MNRSASRRLPSASRRRARAEAGLSVVDVLVASLVTGIAIVGAALMFGSGSAWVSLLGEDRVALGLAQQRIEELRDRGWAVNLAQWAAANIVTEPCLIPGGGPKTLPCPTAAGAFGPARSFTRVTCAQHVDPRTPAGLAAPAYTPDCPLGPDPCAGVPGCVSTVRVTVVVTPNDAGPTEVPKGTPLRLQAWLSESGR